MTALDPTIPPLGRRLLCERASKGFADFQRLLHPEASAEPYISAPHLEAIAWTLQRVIDGGLKRVLIAAPPRHFKSYQVSMALPAFLLGLDPSLKIVCASYGSDLANDFAAKSRRILLSPTYGRVFPQTRLSSKNPAVDSLLTTVGGYRLATSIGGPLTGKGADFIILDDPLKASDATSPIAREATFSWLKDTAMTRFDKPAAGVMIVAMQRLHQDDIIGRLLAEGGWELLELPSEAVTPFVLQTGPTSSVTFEPGDILFPERFGPAILEDRRRELGEAAYGAQYLQRPTPPGGNLFKLKHFRRFDQPNNNRKEQYEKVIFSMDPGVSISSTADYTAYTVWGVRGDELYLLTAGRGRWRFDEQLQRLVEWREKVDILIVERSHIGITLLEELRRTSGHEERLCGYTPRLEKRVRAEYAAAFSAKGTVFLPETAPWLDPIVQELSSFPNGTHDDFVDSFSQLVHVLAAGAPPWFGLKAFKSGSPVVHGYVLG